MRPPIALAIPALAAAATTASAQSLFEVQVTPDDPSVMGITAGDSSLLDLTESLLDTSGAFAPLAGEDFGASLRYAGVDDAVRFRLENISQDVLINGGRVTAPIGENAYAYAGLAYTRFLEDAAVQDFYTPMAGVGYGAANGFDFRLGYEGDFGDGYESHGLRVGLALPF